MNRPAFTQDRFASMAYVVLAYQLVIGMAWWTFGAFDLAPLWAMSAGLFASALLCFVAMLPVNNGSVFDPWWSVLPPFAALYFLTLAAGEGLSDRQLAVLVVVVAWSLRLTLNWLRDYPGLTHEDFRYVDLYEKTPLPRWAVRLFLVDLFPALQVVLGCLPLYPALVLGGGGFGALDLLALVVGLVAVALQLVADEQMRWFKRKRAEGENMSTGLWRYSRHPNYLGEILFWVSLFLFGLAAAPGWWWTGVGAVAMILMFVFASVPMMDDRSMARRPGYADYARRTSALLPWPPRRD